MANIWTDKHAILAFGGDLARRRWWLLTEAAKCAPLSVALEIARAAEAFLAGGAAKAAPNEQPVAAAKEADHSGEAVPSAAEALVNTLQYLH